MILVFANMELLCISVAAEEEVNTALHVRYGSRNLIVQSLRTCELRRTLFSHIRIFCLAL